VGDQVLVDELLHDVGGLPGLLGEEVDAPGVALDLVPGAAGLLHQVDEVGGVLAGEVHDVDAVRAQLLARRDELVPGGGDLDAVLVVHGAVDHHEAGVEAGGHAVVAVADLAAAKRRLVEEAVVGVGLERVGDVGQQALGGEGGHLADALHQAGDVLA
jgi:hypothetical protein